MGDYPQVDPTLFAEHALSIQDIQFGSLALAAIAVLLMASAFLPMYNQFQMRLEALFMRCFVAESSNSRCLTALQVAEKELRRSRHRLEQNLLLHMRKRHDPEAAI